MQIYLPIAEVPVDALLLLALGGAVGILAGMFGVGGGFLATPLLIFVGIPPAVAVATQANQIVASSVSGVLAHWRRGNVDVRMGMVLLTGGFVGSTLGVFIFQLLSALGQIDLVINISYVVLLTVIGLLLVSEGTRALLRRRRRVKRGKLHVHTWLHGLPLKLRFRKSRLYISAILPLGIGVIVGILSATMGIGGGFILVPLMIYLLGMPTNVVIGTSLFQTIFVAANVTFLQAVQNQTVDVVLAMILTFGSVIGAQYGTRLAARLPADALRIMFGVIILALSVAMVMELVLPPVDIYVLDTRG